MGPPDDMYYRTSAKRGKAPLIALWRRLHLEHYRFRLTYGLTCQTPGEELVTHLFCILLLVGALWLSYRLFAYSLLLLTQVMPQLAEASIVRSVLSAATTRAKNGYHSLSAVTSMHAALGGQLMSAAATVSRNASALKSP